jgi:hypothetical protein
MSHLQFFLVCLAGWVNRNQQNLIEYLQEEVKVLKEQLDKKPRFSDDQRRRLAAKAKQVGPSRLATFSTPCEWSDATMYLRNPWDCTFSHLFVADHSGPIEFDLHTRRSIPLTKKRQDWLAAAVLDGLLYDLDESEFILACSRKPRSLNAKIWYPFELAEHADLKPKKNRHGIYWCRQMQNSWQFLPWVP